VWAVGCDAETGDLASACHDGTLRIFTRRASAVAGGEEIAAWEASVAAAASSGRSKVDVASLPSWEGDRFNMSGPSEGHVQLFRREEDGVAIATQWSSASGTWTVVGVVADGPSEDDSGMVDGVKFDHVYPIEIDVPGGSVKTLQIGYNTGMNPFVAAQTFIDKHELDQGYLHQVADYISKRAGAGGVTLGGAASSSDPPAPTSSSSSSTPPAPTLRRLPYAGAPLRADSGLARASLDKILARIDAAAASRPATDAVRTSLPALRDLCDVLLRTSRYHSSTLPQPALDALLAGLRTPAAWPSAEAFPLADLCRLAALHPDAAGGAGRQWSADAAGAVCDRCAGDDVPPENVPVAVTGLRFLANVLAACPAEADAARFLTAADKFAASPNKTVRLCVSAVALNAAHALRARTAPSPPDARAALYRLAASVLRAGRVYEAEPATRVLVACGTGLWVERRDGGAGTAAAERDAAVAALRAADLAGFGTAATEAAEDIGRLLA